MKKINIAAYFGCLLMSCSSKQQAADRLQAFIPGSYVRVIDHQFAKGSDTLVVRWLPGNALEVVKRSGFARIRNGKSLPAVQEIETWSCLYDPATGLVHEQRTGRILTFVPAEQKLLVGASAYQKIEK